MTGRGQANVLTRATAILAALFFATSLGLTLLARYGHGNQLNFNVPAWAGRKGAGAALVQGAGQRARPGACHPAAARGRRRSAARGGRWQCDAGGAQPGRHRDAGRAERHARAQESAGARQRPRKPSAGGGFGSDEPAEVADAPQQRVDGMARPALALPKSGESR